MIICGSIMVDSACAAFRAVGPYIFPWFVYIYMYIYIYIHIYIYVCVCKYVYLCIQFTVQSKWYMNIYNIFHYVLCKSWAGNRWMCFLLRFFYKKVQKSADRIYLKPVALEAIILQI